MQRFQGLALKAARVRAGLTQAQLGEKLGVSGQAILRCEHGAAPNANRLMQLAEVLGYPFDYFFEDIEDVA